MTRYLSHLLSPSLLVASEAQAARTANVATNQFVAIAATAWQRCVAWLYATLCEPTYIRQPVKSERDNGREVEFPEA